MRIIFAVGLILSATTVFSENQLVLKTDGPDLYPLMFRISSGSVNVVWECEKYFGDYDIIFAKYYNGKWIESQRGSGWPYADPYVNHHHPALAIGSLDEKLYVFAQGPFPPSLDTIGDNFFWAASTDTGYNWTVTWLPQTQWFKDCANLAAANVAPDMWVVFQDNHDQNNPNIRAFHFLNGQPYPPTDIAVESYPETNPAITGSGAGFLIAWEARSGGSWNIYAKKPGGQFPITIAADPSKDELHPCLASSGNYFYCAYTKGNDIDVAYSLDGGNNFHPVTVAAASQKQDWPAVACSGPNVDVAYYHYSGNIFHRHSSDNGVTWSKPDTVTTMPTAVDSPRVAILYGNPCWVIWIDNRDGSPNLYSGRAATAGVDEEVHAPAPEIKISPNPFSVKTKIEYPAGTLEICNSLGRQVAKFNGPGPVVLDGSNLPAGVYFINFKYQAGIKTGKAILLK